MMVPSWYSMAGAAQLVGRSAARSARETTRWKPRERAYGAYLDHIAGYGEVSARAVELDVESIEFALSSTIKRLGIAKGA